MTHTSCDLQTYTLLAELALKADFGARVGQTIAGRLIRGPGGRFSSSGAAPDRSAALLRQAHQEAARVRAEANRTGRRGKGKARRKGKAATAKPTAADRAAQRAHEQQVNQEKVFAKLGLDAAAVTALQTLATGDQPSDAAALIARGLAQQDRAGQLRLTPQGRALMLAAHRGDAGRARDALSLGTDRATVAKEKADKHATKEPAGKGGGKGGSARLTKEEQQAQARQTVLSKMQEANAGLSDNAYTALLDFADGNASDPTILQQLADETGLIEIDSSGGYRMTKQGRAFVHATNSGNVRGAHDALSMALDTINADATKTVYLRTGDDVHSGAMIALLWDDATRQALCEAADLDPDDPDTIADHCTLVYLGSDVTTPEMQAKKNAVIGLLADIAGLTAPFTMMLNGYGRFIGTDQDEGDPLYVNVDSPDLIALRQFIVGALQGTAIAVPSDHGFTAHTTLTYLDPAEALPDVDIPQLTLPVTALALVWAGETMLFPLDGEQDEANKADEAVECAESPEPCLITPPAPPSDALIYDGGAVKTFTDGRIGGALVYFSTDADPDITTARDFFTKETDFVFHQGMRTPIYYDHGMDPVLKHRIIGWGTLQMDDTAIWIETQLERRDTYERHIADLAAQGKLGWSSGTAPHLVVRAPIGTAHKIMRWPLGLDASLTPTPGEPRAQAYPLKSLFSSPIVVPWPQASGDDAAQVDTTQRTSSSSIHTQKGLDMTSDELRALLADAFKSYGEQQQTRDETRWQAVEARLKVFEDAPALKSAGYISMDGGSADATIKSFADWLLAVKRNDVKRLTTVYGSIKDAGTGVEIKDLSGASGASGGYLVPVEYEKELARVAALQAIVEPRARAIPMGSSTKMVPMLKQTANPSALPGSSAFFGGLTFSWNPEGADIVNDKSDPQFEMIEFIARKLTGMTVSSMELTEDAPTLESELVQLFGEGLASAKDYFHLRGDGVGKPLGILNSPAKYLLARKASGNAVEIEDVGAMMARLIPSGMANAVWVAHPLIISDLIQLKIGDTPVFQPDAKGSVAGTLLGRPLAFSEYVSAPGTTGDLALCDFRFYGVGTRRGITIASSEHARFTQDQLVWKITYRGDGQPLLSSTIKLADGANTEVSPFVVLA